LAKSTCCFPGFTAMETYLRRMKLIGNW